MYTKSSPAMSLVHVIFMSLLVVSILSVMLDVSVFLSNSIKSKNNISQVLPLVWCLMYLVETEEIEMIGAHSSPQGEIPQDTYDEIVRSIGKNGAEGSSTEPYSIMMQDSNWIAGSPIKIFPKEGNRISVKYMKAGLRQASRSTASKEEKNR